MKSLDILKYFKIFWLFEHKKIVLNVWSDFEKCSKRFKTSFLMILKLLKEVWELVEYFRNIFEDLKGFFKFLRKKVLTILKLNKFPRA